MVNGVSRHVLDNGLTVLLKPVHAAPLVSWWVMYRVGSRNEPTGMTGASHWVEHMLFKGTEQFPSGVLDRLIDRMGGTWNAQTFLDYTAYYETLPADQIGLALRIEADRMHNAPFAPDDVESERTVIISERQGLENAPGFWLEEAVSAAAFRVHGYHHDVIGDLADLETMTRDELYAHYRRYYAPNNAVAVAVGAFDPDALLTEIAAVYGAIPRAEVGVPFVRAEPEQQGERRVTVERPSGAALFAAAYHAPPARTDDWFALTLVNSVLCGADGFGGGGIDNKTSRLYRALVDGELAAGVGGALTPTIDPYLYTINATALDGIAPAAIEETVDRELARLHADGVSAAELTRAKKQARALFAYGTERVTSQAYWLAHSEIFADYAWFEGFVERLDAVTPDQVNAAAHTWLRPQNRVVGWLVPNGEPDDDGYDDEADDDV